MIVCREAVNDDYEQERGAEGMKHLKKYLLQMMILWSFLLYVCAGHLQAASGLEVHFLNVGQGDATLIRCGTHAMLIDAGGEDDTEPVLNYILNKQNLTGLDYVIGTHPHEDHIGSLDEVIKAVEVGEVLLPDVTTNTNSFYEVLTSLEEKNMGITVPSVGEVYPLGDASFTVIAPNEDYKEDLNNWSIGVKVTYGDTSFLFTGDAEADAEADIVDTGLELQADVLKAGHHGSETSNSEKLLEAVHPSYAVISCGVDNSYGHPHKEVLDRLEQHGIQIFRTDQQGTIVAYSDGDVVTWDHSIWEQAEGNQVWEEAGQISSYSEPGKAEEEPSIQNQQEVPVEQTVHITRTGEKYHAAGCRYLSKSDIPISLFDAKRQGYTPCSKCSPPG